MAHAYVRSHNVTFATKSSNGLSCPANVERVVDVGWGSRVYLRLEDGQIIVAQADNSALENVSIGRLRKRQPGQGSRLRPRGKRNPNPDELAVT